MILIMDEDDWEDNFGALRESKGKAVLLVMLLIPYAIQVAALLAENLMMMLITMSFLQMHIENFLEEMKR